MIKKSDTKQLSSSFDEYLKQGEPSQVEKTKAWKAAIGMQQVDALKPSDYLISAAKQNIEGYLTLDEVSGLILLTQHHLLALLLSAAKILASRSNHDHKAPVFLPLFYHT